MFSSSNVRDLELVQEDVTFALPDCVKKCLNLVAAFPRGEMRFFILRDPFHQKSAHAPEG